MERVGEGAQLARRVEHQGHAVADRLGHVQHVLRFFAGVAVVPAVDLEGRVAELVAGLGEVGIGLLRVQAAGAVAVIGAGIGRQALAVAAQQFRDRRVQVAPGPVPQGDVDGAVAHVVELADVALEVVVDARCVPSHPCRSGAARASASGRATSGWRPRERHSRRGRRLRCGSRPRTCPAGWSCPCCSATACDAPSRARFLASNPNSWTSTRTMVLIVSPVGLRKIVPVANPAGRCAGCSGCPYRLPCSRAARLADEARMGNPVSRRASIQPQPPAARRRLTAFHLRPSFIRPGQAPISSAISTVTANPIVDSGSAVPMGPCRAWLKRARAGSRSG